jgi:SPP1 family predicted phage head-tail adaptor
MVDLKRKTRNAYGEEAIAWTTNVANWADVRPVRGANYFASMQLQSAITHQVTMRYITLGNTTEIRPGYCRVRFGSTGQRVLNIISVINPDERNISLELMCAEEV